MQIKKSLNQTARRLREARREAGLTQEDVAKLTGYQQSYIAGIENGHAAPSDLYVAQMVKHLDLRREWLETGEGHIFWYLGQLKGVKPEMIWPTIFAPKLRKKAKKLREKGDSFIRQAKALEEQARPLDQATFQLIPVAQEGGQAGDRVSEIGNSLPGEPQLPGLLERLRQATAAPGCKTELSAWLGVPPASLSQWLAGTREPGGEYALRLLRWVQGRERAAGPGTAR